MGTSEERTRRLRKIAIGAAITAVAAVLAATLAPWRGSAPDDTSLPAGAYARSRFVVMGDSRARGSSGMDTNEPVLRRLATAISKLDPPPRFVVFNGDYAKYELGDGRSDHYTQWKRAMEPVTGAGIAVMHIPGNHEVSEEEFSDNFSMSAETARLSPMSHGDMSPDAFTYSTRIEGLHLLVLNNYATGRRMKLSAEQIEFVRRELSRNRDVVSVVASHEPAFPVAKHIGSSLDSKPQLRDELMRTLAAGGVPVLFVSHEHHYSRRTIDAKLVPGMQSQVLQLNTSTAGIAAGRGPAVEVDFFRSRTYAYCLCDVTPKGLVIRAYDVNGGLFDTVLLPRPIPAE